ncbi:MAG TPA: glycosyltransferase family 4 protein [Puia sp.]|nr:glycosyltransferase family 4 protein [Puia sp.]
MRILMVIDSLVRGGKERRMLELIKGLKQHSGEFDIFLVSLTDILEYEYVYHLPIRFTVLKRKFKKDPSIVFALRHILNTFRPDIIHSWSTMSSIYLSAANFFRRTPLINAVLADAFANLTIRDKHYLRVKLTTPFSAVFVSNSKAGIQAYRTPPRKSVCIYNGLDFGRFENLRPTAEVEQEILGGKKDGRLIIGMVAAFDERKDYPTLMKVALRLCLQRKDLVFVLVGDGHQLAELRSTVPENLLNTQIIFTGKRSDIESVLQIIDIGVLITFYEGISNAIIEYMAMGKPVIATNGGGTAELVEDGVNGYLVAQQDEMEIEQKIRLLLEDPALRERIGNYNREWVRKQFDLKEKTEQYIALYRQLSGKPVSPPKDEHR